MLQRYVQFLCHSHSPRQIVAPLRKLGIPFAVYSFTMRNYITAAIFALAFIIGGLILSRAYNYKFKARNTVNVLGSASHNFNADLVVWSGTYTRTSFELKDAYTNLKNDELQVRNYLKSMGISDAEVTVSSISIEKQYNYAYDVNGRQTSTTFNGYQLRQNVKVESKNIEKVETISREITKLLESGIELSSQEPMYYYTKLADLKIDLLSRASADAYNRAESIAKNAHSKLGSLRRASMGVFQITGQYSNEDFTYGGVYNVTSRNKTATITVRLEYELD
jgi:hypothetical protein